MVIRPADKGSYVVVLDRLDYIQKMTTLLNNRDTYQVMDQDPTRRMQNEMNKMLKQYKEHEHLGKTLYESLRCTNGIIPRIYGNPKIHKEGLPLRPIVSFYTSPTYQLSQHLCWLLTPLLGETDSSVKNSLDFIEMLKDWTITEDQRMVSFDVVSLFMNVPTDPAIQVAKRRLEEDDGSKERTELTTREILCLLKFCLNATYFTFQSVVYWQKYRTAMGSPVSVKVANLVMEDIEERALKTYHTQIPVWKRCVDDTFVIIQEDLIEEFHSHLNSIEKTIQFTKELEKEKQLFFLYVRVLRKEDVAIKQMNIESLHVLDSALTTILTVQWSIKKQ